MQLSRKCRQYITWTSHTTYRWHKNCMNWPYRVTYILFQTAQEWSHMCGFVCNSLHIITQSSPWPPSPTMYNNATLLASCMCTGTQYCLVDKAIWGTCSMWSSLACNLCVYFMFGRGSTCSCGNMNRWHKSRSVGKWMCNCSDNGLVPARQFVVWFSFNWQNVSPPMKFTINWYSCVVMTELQCSMSGIGADSAGMVEWTWMVMMIAPVEMAHHAWKRIQHERVTDFGKPTCHNLRFVPCNDIVQWNCPQHCPWRTEIKQSRILKHLQRWDTRYNVLGDCAEQYDISVKCMSQI